MFDFRLKVFYVVARRLNFTKAAEELFISQPAVSKHIREIEAHYHTRLFERNGTKIKLSIAGTVLLESVAKLMDVHGKMDADMASLTNKLVGSLRIGASNTISSYVLPKYLAAFKQNFPEVEINLISGNTETIENLLLENKIDVGLVEGQSKRQHIVYQPWCKDELVLCTANGKLRNRELALSVAELKTIPMVLREPGSGSLEVIDAALKHVNINPGDLQREITLESTEAIKSYLLESESHAFLSVHAILKELKCGDLKIVDVDGLDIRRFFYFITHKTETNNLIKAFLKSILAKTS
ncbi:LysR family transcriptional regulator [Pedobacter aquatilis]|uniref:LysR family transcriptional regulator n=1 Tax=Pedobacter aquatilis TaxID=351343 RepID=UPI0029307EB3|nr:LysR family transcriptional regulator [Pedobacter aquatilis]